MMTDNSSSAADRFWAALARVRRAAFLLVIFGFAVNLLYLATPLYMMQVYDRVLASRRIETLVYLTLITLGALFALALIEAVRGRIQIRMGLWLDRELSGDLIASSVLSSLGGAAANAQPLRDLNAMREFVTGGLRAMLDVPWTPVFIAALWVLHPWLGWLGLGAALTLFALAVLNELVSRGSAQRANSGRVTNLNLVERAIQNADVIAAMGMLPRLTALWNTRNQIVLDGNRIAGDRNAVIQGITRFVRLGAQTAVLGLGAYLVILDQLTAGTMIAASILLGRALAPIEQVIGAWRGFLSSRSAKKRIRALVEAMPPATDQMPLPAPRGEISCRDVWLAQGPGEVPILQAITFKLRPGEVMAITGPSASGKTSLCRLIVGSWRPTKGHVRLDGSDVWRWSSEDLGSHVGYLPQDVELFSATIAANISRFADKPDPRDVVAAAVAAGVHDMILALPKGYDTVIGPQNTYLSGGQRQRIGLARALYRRPRLIVLDEPNSNLDSAGEEALLSAIEEARRWGATVIVVTHSRRLLEPVDKILMLVAGEQKTFAPRDEVLTLARVPTLPKPQTVPDISAAGRARP